VSIDATGCIGLLENRFKFVSQALHGSHRPVLFTSNSEYTYLLELHLYIREAHKAYNYIGYSIQFNNKASMTHMSVGISRNAIIDVFAPTFLDSRVLQ